MKCVCPMGGDRECPDNCTYWRGLPKEQRQPIVIGLAKKGQTQDQIAKELNVNQSTIHRDLDGIEFMHLHKSKPAKTATNPKGAGRPKGSTKPKQQRGTAAKYTKAREIVRPLVEADEDLETAELEKAHGISKDTLERAALAEQARKDALIELHVDPKTLSMTAQQKLDLVIRQEKARLAESFRETVNKRVREFLEETILPRHRAEQEEAKRVMNVRKGVMDKATFKLIWSALHPDSRRSISDKKLAEAFDAFSRMEKLLLVEKDSPTDWQRLPQTLTEWDKMKAAATAARRAKRAGVSSLRPR